MNPGPRQAVIVRPALAAQGRVVAGGGRSFGPVVRSHEIGLPKKVRALGLRHALSTKAKAGNIVVLDGFEAKPGQRVH